MSEPSISLSTLIESGVHFGHRHSRWNPKMKPFIYGRRNQIHIINLRETIKGLVRATNFLEKVALHGDEVVFVGTKRQARELVKKHAQACHMHWISERWLGGMLTNFSTVLSRVQRMDELENLESTGEIEDYSKKMVSSIRREHRKIVRNLDGVRHMKQLPKAIVLIDPSHEHICAKEARKLGIPIVAIMDTDSDPDTADIVIPGNDDAFRSLEVLLKPLTDAMKRGRERYKSELEKQRAAEEARRREEAKRQDDIKKAVAEKRKQEQENAAKIAEARKKHLEQKGGPDEAAAEAPAEAPAAAAQE